MPLKKLPGLALLVTLLVPGMAQAKDFAIVVNKASTARNLSAAEVQKLLKSGLWPDGKALTLVVARLDSPEMKLVFQKLGGAPEEKVFGSRLVVLESDEAIVEMVARTPGALGIVDLYSINGHITVVRLEGKLPLEPGYTLHSR